MTISPGLAGVVQTWDFESQATIETPGGPSVGLDDLTPAMPGTVRGRGRPLSAAERGWG